MKKFRKFVTAIAVTTGLTFGSTVLAAPAANAEDFNFTVTATSFDRAEQSATIKSQKRLTINGAQQVTWENSNHGVTVTAAQIKSAPKITTSCTSSNRLTQSKQIFNKTHGARVVVVKAGSCVWNRGMRDQHRVGFKYKVTTPIVLRVDSSHRYRHSHTLKVKSKLLSSDTIVGKVYVLGAWRYIVKSCLNFIGGPVDVVAPAVIQVRYAKDVKYSGELEVKSAVKADVTFNITCPNGANFNTTIEASAYGYARDEISFTERTRVSVVAAKRVTLNDSSWLHAEQEAVSEAKIKITVQGSCGDTPPPTYTAPSVSANASACVEPGQATGIVTVTATNNNDVAVPATYSFPGKPDQAASFSSNQTIAKQFTGLAPGTYTGTVSFGTPVNKTAQYNVTVLECAAPVNNRPVGEIVQWPAHLEPSEYYRVKVVGSDPEDGGAVDLLYSVSGGAVIVTGDANHPTICDIEGTNKVCTFWIRANQSVGVEYEISLQVRDGSGLTSPVYTKTGMVQAMPV